MWGWGDEQEAGCFLLKWRSICFGKKAAFVLSGVYGLIKWSVILVVFPHFIFIICSVLILNTNCYACSNTLSVAKKFAGWDDTCALLLLLCVFAEARLAPSPRNRKMQTRKDSRGAGRRMSCSWKKQLSGHRADWLIRFQWRNSRLKFLFNKFKNKIDCEI